MFFATSLPEFHVDAVSPFPMKRRWYFLIKNLAAAHYCFTGGIFTTTTFQVNELAERN